MLHFKDGPEQLRCYAGYVAGVFTMLFAFLARSLVIGSLIGFAGAMLVVMIARVGLDQARKYSEMLDKRDGFDKRKRNEEPIELAGVTTLLGDSIHD